MINPNLCHELIDYWGNREKVANVVGSVVLCILAVVEGQIGFILLEGVWAIVSAWSLFVILGEEAGPHP